MQSRTSATLTMLSSGMQVLLQKKIKKTLLGLFMMENFSMLNNKIKDYCKMHKAYHLITPLLIKLNSLKIAQMECNFLRCPLLQILNSNQLQFKAIKCCLTHLLVGII